MVLVCISASYSAALARHSTTCSSRAPSFRAQRGHLGAQRLDFRGPPGQFPAQRALRLPPVSSMPFVTAIPSVRDPAGDRVLAAGGAGRTVAVVRSSYTVRVPASSSGCDRHGAHRTG